MLRVKLMVEASRAAGVDVGAREPMVAVVQCSIDWQLSVKERREERREERNEERKERDTSDSSIYGSGFSGNRRISYR